MAEDDSNTSRHHAPLLHKSYSCPNTGLSLIVAELLDSDAAILVSYFINCTLCFPCFTATKMRSELHLAAVSYESEWENLTDKMRELATIMLLTAEGYHGHCDTLDDYRFKSIF